MPDKLIGLPLDFVSGIPIIEGMDFKKIIAELIAGGMTQTQIADSCGCSQSTISDIATGEITNPAYRIGAALVALQQLALTKKAA